MDNIKQQLFRAEQLQAKAKEQQENQQKELLLKQQLEMHNQDDILGIGLGAIPLNTKSIPKTESKSSTVHITPILPLPPPPEAHALPRAAQKKPSSTIKPTKAHEVARPLPAPLLAPLPAPLLSFGRNDSTKSETDPFDTIASRDAEDKQLMASSQISSVSM
jgi:hypothetical protein